MPKKKTKPVYKHLSITPAESPHPLVIAACGAILTDRQRDRWTHDREDVTCPPCSKEQ